MGGMAIESEDYVFVDTETTGLDPRTDKLRIVAIDGIAYDIWKDHEAARCVQDLEYNRDKTFVAHNAQFDLDFLAEHMKYEHVGSIFDTMVASQLMNAGRRYPNGKPLSNSLDAVAQRILGVKLDKTFQKADWSKQWIDEQMLNYAAQDTTVLEPLVRELSAGLKNAGLWRIFRLEMQLLPILVAAKRRGIRVDRDAALKLVAREEKKAAKLSSQLPMIEDGELVVTDDGTGALFAPDSFIDRPKVRLNPRSSAHVQSYFGLPDATEDTLRDYVKETGDETAKKVMEIKKHLKRASSIQKQLLDRLRTDGRIHPSFNQTFTETGRLSSREPNLQNQDHSQSVRSLFVPEPGNAFVIADYSQLELRLAAYFSGDRNMLNAYRSGRDLHTETQLRIFGDPEQMSADEKKKTRTLAKNINFGLVYGGGHGVLIRFAARSGVDLPEDEAIEYRKAFREAYPQLVEWQNRQGNTAPEYVYTNLGRRRYITPGEGYCTRINNIVQGSAADGMKLAMVYMYRRDGILPIGNIHDEVIVECTLDSAEYIKERVRLWMIESMYISMKTSPRNPVVEIEVEAGIADSWAEKG